MTTVLLVVLQPRFHPLLLVVVQRTEKVAEQLLMQSDRSYENPPLVTASSREKAIR